jgi:hypothetical protein
MGELYKLEVRYKTHDEWLEAGVTALYEDRMVRVTARMGDEVYFQESGDPRTKHAEAHRFSKVVSPKGVF